MKKFFIVGFVLTALCSGGLLLKSSQSSPKLTATQLEILEALSDGEGGGSVCKWKRAEDKFGCRFHICSPEGDGHDCYPCGTETLD